MPWPLAFRCYTHDQYSYKIRGHNSICAYNTRQHAGFRALAGGEPPPGNWWAFTPLQRVDQKGCFFTHIKYASKNFAEMRCVGVFCLTEKQIRDIISISNIGNIFKINRKEVNAGERSKGLWLYYSKHFRKGVFVDVRGGTKLLSASYPWNSLYRSGFLNLSS